jgi:MFS family permease
MGFDLLPVHILAAPMARELGVSAGFVFATFSAALVVAAVLGPLVGRRIDIFGGRDVLTISSLVFAGGLAMLGVAQGAGMLFAGWLVIGIGMAMGLYEAAFSTLTGIYGRDARGAIAGITLLAWLASTILLADLRLSGGRRWLAHRLPLLGAAVHIVIGLPLNRLLVPLGTQHLLSATNDAAHRSPDAPKDRTAMRCLCLPLSSP